MHRQDSSTHPPFVDGRSSANSGAQTESTAPSGNLASILRNWTLLSSEEMPSPRGTNRAVEERPAR